MTADLIVHGGPVYVLDEAGTVAEAVAVRDGRVLAAGPAGDILALRGAGTRLLHTGGRAVVPGLVDGHAHFDREGLKEALPSLAGARSIADILDRIAELVRAARPGEWIVTMPVGEPPYYVDPAGTLAENRFPDRHDLDRVSPDNPVYIRAIWGFWRHQPPLVSIANTAALRLAGVGRDTPSPHPAVEIQRDAAGEPTGVFVEWTPMPIAELTLLRAVPGFTHEQRVAGLRASAARYHATGTTSVFEAHGVADEVLAAYQELAGRGELTMRASLAMSPSWGSLDTGVLFGPWGRWLAGRGLGDDMLRMSGLFVEPHGSDEDRVRATAMPYTGWAGFSSDAALPPGTDVTEFLVKAARHRMRVVLMGTELLDVLGEVDRRVPLRGLRWVIGHISVLTAEQIRRIAELGLLVTTHTNRYLYKQSEDLAGEVDEESIVPLRALLDAGVPVSLGTDNVPTSLFHPVWHCVARRGRRTGRVVGAGQRLTRFEALRLATAGGAYLTFDEAVKGTLRPGAYADLAVLSADPMRVPEEELPAIVADLTMVGGRAVHRSPDLDGVAL